MKDEIREFTTELSPETLRLALKDFNVKSKTLKHVKVMEGVEGTLNQCAHIDDRSSSRRLLHLHSLYQ